MLSLGEGLDFMKKKGGRNKLLIYNASSFILKIDMSFQKSFFSKKIFSYMDFLYNKQLILLELSRHVKR